LTAEVVGPLLTQHSERWLVRSSPWCARKGADLGLRALGVSAVR
jgi:hypothetical protein